MHRVAALTTAAVLTAAFGAAQTEVRKAGDKLDVRATAAAVSEVLDRIARETGMKVSYDGAPPRARVSMSLTGVTPTQAVLSVLEGQGLNYALRMDRTGAKVETLLLVAGGGTAAAPQPAPRAPRPVEREPEPAEAEEEAPPEVAPAVEERRPGFPFPGLPNPPSGPAMPLTLPTPPPANPSPTGPNPPPQD